MQAMTKALRPLTLLAATFSAGQLMAQDAEVIGKPQAGGTGFQPAATDIARAAQGLDDLLLYMCYGIAGFVGILMLWIIVFHNRRANPTPKSFTHNTPIEIAWTLIPIIILVFIGANSLPVLFQQQEIPEGDVVVKVTGYQWYWGYEYVDEGFGFDSFMIGQGLAEAEAKEAVVAAGYTPDLWKLATDTVVVVPTGKKIVMQVTGADVIHSWTIPAFGVKQDAVPGRLAELWFTVDPGMEGVYFGQCSELCGINHAYMPITVKAVTPEEYDAWLASAKEEYAGIPQTLTVASAE